MINGFGPGPSPQGLILKVKHLLYCTVDSSSFYVGDNLMCKTDRCRISGYTVHFQNNTYRYGLMYNQCCGAGSG